MKNKFVVFLLIVSLVVVSCKTTDVRVFNPSESSEENLATIKLHTDIVVYEIDGVEVPYGRKSFKIDAGKHNFTLRYSDRGAFGVEERYSNKGTSTYLIEKGKTYNIYPSFHSERILSEVRQYVYFRMREDTLVLKRQILGKIKREPLPRDIDFYFDKFPEDREYEIIQTLHVQLAARTLVGKTPSMDDVDYIMKKEAIELGADAIVDMYYETAF